MYWLRCHLAPSVIFSLPTLSDRLVMPLHSHVRNVLVRVGKSWKQVHLHRSLFNISILLTWLSAGYNVVLMSTGCWGSGGWSSTMAPKCSPNSSSRQPSVENKKNMQERLYGSRQNSVGHIWLSRTFLCLELSHWPLLIAMQVKTLTFVLLKYVQIEEGIEFLWSDRCLCH